MRKLMMLTVAAIGLGLAAGAVAAEPYHTTAQEGCYYDEGVYVPTMPWTEEKIGAERALLPEPDEMIKERETPSIAEVDRDGDRLPDFFNDEGVLMPVWR